MDPPKVCVSAYVCTSVAGWGDLHMHAVLLVVHGSGTKQTVQMNTTGIDSSINVGGARTIADCCRFTHEHYCAWPTPRNRQWPGDGLLHCRCFLPSNTV